jgi:hypothetical protein
VCRVDAPPLCFCVIFSFFRSIDDDARCTHTRNEPLRFHTEDTQLLRLTNFPYTSTLITAQAVLWVECFPPFACPRVVRLPSTSPPSCTP